MPRQNRVQKRGKNRKLKFQNDNPKVESLAKNLPKGFGKGKTARLLNAQENFKKLESKVKKWGGEIDYEKSSLPEIKKMSRSELNRYTRYLEHAVNNPTVHINQYNIKFSELERKQSLIAGINRQKGKEYARRLKLPLLEGGKQEELRGQKLTVDYLRYLKHGEEGTGLFKFQFNPARFKTAEEFFEYFMDLEEKAKGGYGRNRDIQTVAGYIKALNEQGFTGFEEGRKLQEKILNLDPVTAVDIISSNRDASFEFLYGKSAIKGRLETLIEVFNREEG